MEIDVDFESDLRIELKKLYNRVGLRMSNKNGIDKILLDYLNVFSKIIPEVSRYVQMNPDFVKDIFFHPKRKEIEFIYNVARNGGNLNSFQSKRLLQTNFHDHLRNEWNIFHFHLSIERDNKNPLFVKQVNSLLFTYIDDNNIIFLGAENHKERTFYDEKWLRILHNHFPHIIKQFRIPETEDTKVLTPFNSNQLWYERCAIALTRIDGDIYRNPGLGQVTSGHNVLIVKQTNEILRWIYHIEKQLKKYCIEICNELGLNLGFAKFRLRCYRRFELIEETNNHRILEYPKVFNLEKYSI
ncbi:hypothetical protein DVK85_06665 [Flavobacterium arcticum]|uniref:Uncharacterized protein n=1 Tax=Flavobacterium arcticum TaxID=1784713 RepID=A0A345HBI2_9FLAO|nr:hypothetical protein [Flavobacterium arcticum]AXG73942.1 hypothetical protein DVK85_06665 [Flavobacterium arcticum]KAF2508918.1 hypothetical protein E0W72_10150 [Flavobacterium arcticum]